MTKSYNLVLLFAAMMIFAAVPSNGHAACDPQNDGDCCAKDSDCTMYVNKAYCANMPLNKIAVEKLEKEPPPSSSACTAESIAKLKEQQKSMTPKCISFMCDFEMAGENNG